MSAVYSPAAAALQVRGGAWSAPLCGSLHATDYLPPPALPVCRRAVALCMKLGPAVVGLHAQPGAMSTAKSCHCLPVAPCLQRTTWTFLVSSACMVCIPTNHQAGSIGERDFKPPPNPDDSDDCMCEQHAPAPGGPWQHVPSGCCPRARRLLKQKGQPRRSAAPTGCTSSWAGSCRMFDSAATIQTSTAGHRVPAAERSYTRRDPQSTVMAAQTPTSAIRDRLYILEDLLVWHCYVLLHPI